MYFNPLTMSFNPLTMSLNPLTMSSTARTKSCAPLNIRSTSSMLLFLFILLPSLTFSERPSHRSPGTSTTFNSTLLSKRRFEEALHAQHTQQQFAGGCGACRMREDIKNRNLEVIKSEVLRKMGFQKAPNITGKVLPPIPPHFLAKVDMDLGAMQNDSPGGHHFKTGYSIVEEEDEFHAKTQEILTFAQPYPRLRHGWRGHDILHFTFSDSITKYQVSNATLYLFIRGADRRPLPDVRIEIFKVYKTAPGGDHSPTTAGDHPGLKRMVMTKVTQPFGRGEWIQIDLTVTVSEWFKSPRDNLGFVVNATANGRKVAVTDTQEENGTLSPYVQVSTVESRRRIRRSLGLNCDDSTGERLCCRYSLVVDFEKFEWDFIIAPKRYDAHYCHGECPPVTLQKYPHTHLTKMAVPESAQPCCNPRKLSSISMLYYDTDNNVVFGSLPNMVVDRCGCS